MGNKDRYLKICIQCGSANIKIPPAGMDMEMTKADYCVDCKNMGVFPEVKESKVKAFREKLKNEQTEKY